MPTGRLFSPLKTVGRDIAVISGRFSTDGAGAIVAGSEQIKGAAAYVQRVDVGKYVIGLGRSTDRVDKYHALIKADACILSGAASKQQIKLLQHAVNSVGPYVAFAVSEPGSAEVPSTLIADLLRAGNFPHLEQLPAEPITFPDATDLPTLLALTNQIATTLEAHDDDVVQHLNADAGALGVAAWASAPGDPNDLAEAQAMLNEMKGDWNAHIAKIAVATGDIHHGHDPRALIVSADGNNQGTCETLANELKRRVNASLLSAPPATGVAAVGAPTGFADVISGEIHFSLWLSTTEVDL